MLEGFVPWPDEDVTHFKESGYWEDITLGEHLDKWVENYSDSPALSFHGTEISYKKMDENVTRIADEMIHLGLKPYDRIIIQMFNTPKLVYFIYACLKIGAIPICSLPTHRYSEINFLASEAKARAHLIPGGTIKGFDYEQFALKMREVVPSLEYIFTVGQSSSDQVIGIDDILTKKIDFEAGKKAIQSYNPDPMEPAFFQLSGGTTGVPKIIPRTHNDYYYNAKCSAKALAYDKKSRLLIAVPLMHNAFLVNGLLAIHISGGTVILDESLAPETVLQSIAQNKADMLGTVPVILHRLLEVPEPVRLKYDMTSLKKVLWGGNAIDPSIQEQFRAVFSCDTLQTYGMAEGMCCWNRPDDSDKIKMNTQGRPVSTADEVRVVDLITKKDMPAGQKGECWTRGPYTLRGYYKSDERNKEAFSEDGYYKTGDLIQRDKNGNITVMGRIKDCISRGAEKINAEEVEDHILKFSQVKNVAVVAMPDKIMGERVCAFIVAKDKRSFLLDELSDFLINTEKIAKFKVPERLEFINELPITKVGKFEKLSLRNKITDILRNEGKI